jgi:hypothetical protein
MEQNHNEKHTDNPETKRLRRVIEYMKTFQGIKDLDLLVLKAHVLIEHELERYLAFRLSLTDEECERLEERIKNMSFFHVANIALSGAAHRDLLALVLKLNDVRTQIAHRMEPSSYEVKLADFNRAVWVGKEPGDQYLATMVSLSNVWGQIVRSYLDARYGEGTFESVMS